MRPRETSHLAVLFVAGAILALGGCGSAGNRHLAHGADQLRLQVPGLLGQDQRRALLYASAAEKLDPTVSGNWLLQSADLALRGVSRVLAPIQSSTVTALRTLKTVISSDQSGRVDTWDPSSGQMLASVQVKAPVMRFAASPSPDLIGSVDRSGAIALWNLEDPQHPVELPLARVRTGGRDIVALGFSSRAAHLVAITRTGLVEVFDVSSHKLLATRSLREARGNLPWSARAGALRVAAAKVIPEEFTTKTALLVATPREGVARVDLSTLQGRTVIPGREISGVVTAVDESAYEQPKIAVGTSTGTVEWNSSTRALSIERTGADAGLAEVESALIAGNAQGIATSNLAGTSSASFSSFNGRPARALIDGPGGPVEIGLDGSISLLDFKETGINLETSSSESSIVAHFGPEGNLLETSGYDANHIESLVAVRPGSPGEVDGSPVPNRVVRRYLPSKSWWPENTSGPSGWFVNDAQLGTQYMVAGGQDPTGTAVVLVWNAKTGQPLRRLALTEGGVSTNTQGAATSTPSLVSQVELLPKRHLVAAYSALQELIVLWSTDTWQRVDTIDVGPIADFSVSSDESTLLVTSLSDELSGISAGNSKTRLLFVNVDNGKTEHQVVSNATELAAFAPDSQSIVAMQKGGVLRQMSPDGRRNIAAPITVETGEPRSLAWQPRSKVLAVGLAGGGVSLVDLSTGRVSAPLPSSPGAEPIDVSFSPDGRLLASSNGTVTGEHHSPTSPSIWKRDDNDLEARACEVSGGGATRAEWGRWTASAPYVDVCKLPQPKQTQAPAPSLASRLGGRLFDVAFQRGEDLEVGSPQGHVAVGKAESNSYPTVQFSWSQTGTLVWLDQDLLHSIPPRSTMWTTACACSGAASEGSTVVALESDGSALMRFTPTLGSFTRLPTPGLPTYEPKLMGLARGRVVVVGFPSQPDRGTPSEVYIVDRLGHVRRTLGNAGGAVYGTAAVSPSGDEVAMVASLSSGACFSPEHIVVLNVLTGRLRFPVIPKSIAVPVIRSLSWPRSGSLEASIAPVGCTTSGGPLHDEPPARIYEMHGNTMTPGRSIGYETQLGSLVSATMKGPVAEAATQAGTLTLEDAPGKSSSSVQGVSGFSVRP